MMKKLWAYCGLFYKLVVFLIYPVVLLLVCGFLHFILWVMKEGTEVSVYVSMLLCAAIVVMEIIMDGINFGGMYAKDATIYKFFLSSPNGEKYVGDLLSVDLVRRFLTILVLYGCHLGICLLKEPESARTELKLFVVYVLGTYVLCAVGILVSRFFAGVWMNLIVGYAVSILGNVILALFAFVGVISVVIILTVLSAVSSMVLVFLGKRKVRIGYYDE